MKDVCILLNTIVELIRMKSFEGNQFVMCRRWESEDKWFLYDFLIICINYILKSCFRKCRLLIQAVKEGRHGLQGLQGNKQGRKQLVDATVFFTPSHLGLKKARPCFFNRSLLVFCFPESFLVQLQSFFLSQPCLTGIAAIVSLYPLQVRLLITDYRRTPGTFKLRHWLWSSHQSQHRDSQQHLQTE